MMRIVFSTPGAVGNAVLGLLLFLCGLSLADVSLRRSAGFTFALLGLTVVLEAALR